MREMCKARRINLSIFSIRLVAVLDKLGPTTASASKAKVYASRRKDRYKNCRALFPRTDIQGSHARRAVTYFHSESTITCKRGEVSKYHNVSQNTSSRRTMIEATPPPNHSQEQPQQPSHFPEHLRPPHSLFGAHRLLLVLRDRTIIGRPQCNVRQQRFSQPLPLHPSLIPSASIPSARCPPSPPPIPPPFPKPRRISVVPKPYPRPFAHAIVTFPHVGWRFVVGQKKRGFILQLVNG